jgi:signal transduction histidine kinase
MVEELVEHIRDVSLNLRPGMLDDVGLVPGDSGGTWSSVHTG